MNKVKGFEIVEQFLDNWKKDAIEWYATQYQEYLQAKENRKNNPSYADQLHKDCYKSEVQEKIVELLDQNFKRAEKENYWLVPRVYGYGFHAESKENALVSIMNREYENFQNSWKHVINHLGKKISYSESVEKALQKEYERKYDRLVSDVQKITENIEQADLRIGNTHNIEGFVIGSKGKAELWSTYVEGMIQAPHFRFYCHKR